MKKILIIFLIASSNFLQAQSPDSTILPFNDLFTVHEFNVDVDTIIQTLPDLPCEQVVFNISQSYGGVVYVGRVQNGYARQRNVSTKGAYLFVVHNANEIWFAGSEPSVDSILTIRYLTRKEHNEED